MDNAVNQKAFTLIEIVTVAVIVGVLGIMALPSLTKSMNRSYSQDAMHNLIAIYAAQKNYYPVNGNAYLTCNSGVAATDLNCINNNLGVNIISSGGWTYLCSSNVCQANAAAGTQAGGTSGVVMKISLPNAVNVTALPVYCDNLVTPSYSNNPCCTAGGGAVNTACP